MPDVYDGFEDGDVTEWSLYSGNAKITATTNQAASGSYSGQQSDGESRRDLPTTYDGTVTLTTEFRVDQTTAASYLRYWGGGFRAVDLRINSGSWEYFDGASWTSVGGSPSANTWMTVETAVDVAADTFDLTVDGTALGTGLAFNNSVSAVDQVSVGEFNTNTVWADDLQTGIPFAPSGLAVDATTDTSADLSWTDNSSNEDGFYVYRATASGSTTADYTQVADITTANTTTYTDTGLLNGEQYFYRVTAYNTDGESDVSNEDSGITTLPAPGTPTATVTDDQFDLSWTDNSNNEDGFRVLLSRDGGTSYSQDGTDLAANTTTTTTSNLLDGEQYTIKIRAFTEHVTADSGTDTATTALSDVTGLSFDASVEDQLTASWTDVTDYGNYHIQHRESGTSTWTDDGTVPQSDTDLVISNLADGEKYDVRVRAETEHVQSAWLQLSEVTKLPAPGTPSVTGTTISSIDISWADNADNENGQEVDLREETDNRHETGFEAWATVVDYDPDTTTHTFSDLKSNWKYEFRITAYTEHVTATSTTTVQTTAIDYQDGFTLVLEDGTGDKLAFAHDEMLGVQLPNRHSVINEWSITLPSASGLEDWTYAEAYIWYENARHNIAHQLLYRGEFEVPETTDSRGTTIVRGKDTTRKLKRGGANVTFTSIPYWEAIQDYFQNHLSPEWSATVNQPTTKKVDTDRVMQQADTTSEFDTEISPGATEPFVATNNQLKLCQTCFTREGEQYDSGSDSGAAGLDSSYSDGSAATFDGTGSSITYNFTTEYDIPEGNVSVYARLDTPGASSPPTVNVLLDGTVIDTLPSGGYGLVWSRDLADGNNNYSGSGWANGNLVAGSHTLKLEDAGGGGTDVIAVDVIALVQDNRYSVTFDGAVDSNGYLSGPELYPSAASVLSTVEDQTYNITAGTLTTTLTDTSGQQEIALSNDGGSTWKTAANAELLDTTFSTVGTTIQGRATLGRYGSRTTATPTNGFNGQRIDSWKIDIDTDDLAVIDQTTVTGSHYKNLQTLHRNSGMRFVVDYAENSLPIESFKTGGVTKTADWTTTDHTRTTPDDAYANSVTAWGATDSQGTRLKAVAKDDAAINQDGEEIEAEPLFKPEMDSDADLKSLVRTRLGQALQNDDLTGNVTIIPKHIQPGYSYQVPELDNQTLPLESVEFRIGVDGDSGALDFAGDTDLVSQLTGISTEVSSVKDAF